jgi:hypothetical protein
MKPQKINLFSGAVLFGNYYGPTYTAHFKNGQEATYTAAVLYDLKTDPFVVDIMDNDTGEIIYIAGRENG